LLVGIIPKPKSYPSLLDDQDEPHTLPLTFLALLIEFIDELHYGVQNAVLPSLLQDLGMSYNQVGLLLGLPGVIGGLIEPAIMLLGDTRLRKALVVGGGIVICLSLLLIAGATSFGVVLFAFIISYPASGAFVSLIQATLMDLNPGREPQIMARWTAAGSLGNLIGPLLVACGFALGLGWRWNYIGLALIVVILVIFVLPRRFPKQNADVGGYPTNIKRDLSRLLPNLWNAVKDAGLMRWFILLELSDLLLDIFSGYAAIYFADILGYSPAQVGLLVGAIMLAGFASDILLIPLLERFPGRTIVRTSAALSIFVYIAWLLVPWAWAKLALVIAIQFTTLGWYQVLQGEAYAALPGKSGTVMAINSAVGLLGGSLAYSIGWTADRAGLPVAMWILLIGPLCLALFVPKAQKTI